MRQHPDKHSQVGVLSLTEHELEHRLLTATDEEERRELWRRLAEMRHQTRPRHGEEAR